MTQSFVLSLVSLLLVSSTVVALRVPGKETAGESECVRDVDLYLNELGIELDGDNANERIRSALDDAIEQLEQLDNSLEDKVLKLQKEEALKRLVSSACPPEQLQSFVKGLREAVVDDECSQVSLYFFMAISNCELAAKGKDELRLNEFARRRVESCWIGFVSTVTRGIDRTLGKMSRPVYSLIERLAKKVVDMRSQGAKGKLRDNRVASIEIDENKVREVAEDVKAIWADASGEQLATVYKGNSTDLQATIAMLKQVELEAEANRKDFAQALSSLFNSYRQHRVEADQEQGNFEKKDKTKLIKQAQDFHIEYLVNPCNELMDRLKFLVAQGNIYRGQTKHTLGEALGREKLTNPRLDYELQVYRICKFANEKRRELGLLLANLR